MNARRNNIQRMSRVIRNAGLLTNTGEGIARFDEQVVRVVFSLYFFLLTVLLT